MSNREENVTIITEPIAVNALNAIYENNGPGDLGWNFDIPGQVTAMDDTIIGSNGELSDLYIGEKKLRGILVMHDIPTLELISAWGNAFSGVDLKNLIKLTDLDLNDNEIEDLKTMDN